MKVNAYHNGDDVFIAWKPDGFIPDCRGFALLRKRNGVEETVSTWVGFEDDDAITRAREQLLQAVVQVASELEDRGSIRQHSEALALRPLNDRMTVMDALFERLAQDLNGIKRELGRARSERLEDLTLLVDLITTSWRSVDQRLGRIERKLERIEGSPDMLPSRRALSMAEHREHHQP